jgi:hypothetical protein
MKQYLMNQEGTFYELAAHKQPVFKSLKNKEWILWGYSTEYEDREWNNLQPDYYEWLYNSSSKHRAIVNRKCLFINGKGLVSKDQGLTMGEKVELKAFTFKVNQSDFIKKLTLNLLKQGGFCYEVIQSKDGKTIEAHYINIKNVRRSKVEYDEQGRKQPVTYFYTEHWDCKKPQDNPDFTEFHEFEWERMDNGKRYLVYYQDDEEELYPIPEYTAAVPYIAADYEISNFVYNNIRQGFSAGWLVNFYNGEPDDEEKQQIANHYRSRLHGTDNSGEPVLAFNDQGTNGVDITPLSPNGQDDRFINLNKQVREEIFSGHTVDPVVVGLEGNNGFNNNADEKRTAIEDFQAYYVSGRQMILEKHINAIRAYNDIKGKVEIARLDPIQAQFSAAEIMQIATTDEVREMNGLPKNEVESNKVADALGTISPLVATKVLESMSVKEIRAIVGLDTPKEGIDRGTTESKEVMSKQDTILDFLSNNFIDIDDLEVIHSAQSCFNSIEEAEAKSEEFLNSLEVLLLRLLRAHPGLPLDSLSKLAGKPVSELEPVYNNLKDQGLISEDDEVTDSGLDEIEGEVFVVYKYVKRLQASGSDVIPGTRDFCRNLVRQSRTKRWTLDQIKRMNNDTNLDVFRSGGGYWNNNGNIEPHCRHTWAMEIVRRRNG